MLNKDAANILNLSGSITPKDVKKAFRIQAKKYHPDINPSGENMMKVINEAFDTLKDFTGELQEDEQDFNYPEELNTALNAIKDCLGLNIEICGSWVWVTGETKTHKDTLKEAGFRYASKKKSWSYRPSGWKSKSRGNHSMAEIRDMHGSNIFKGSKQGTFALAAG